MKKATLVFDDVKSKEDLKSIEADIISCGGKIHDSWLKKDVNEAEIEILHPSDFMEKFENTKSF